MNCMDVIFPVMRYFITAGQQMHYLLFTVFLLFFTVPVTAQQVDALIARGDSAQLAMQPDTAMELYREAERLDPDNPDVLWRISKVYSDYASLESSDEAARLQLERSISYAKKAVSAAPKHSMAQVSLAIAYGQKAVVAPNAEKVELSKLVRQHAVRALELESDNHVAMLVLGIWNREVATLNWILKLALDVVYGGLPDASLEESHRLLQRAMRMHPDEIMTHLELAKTLMEMEDERKAERHLRKAITLPKRDIGDRKRVDEARKLLQKLT